MWLVNGDAHFLHEALLEAALSDTTGHRLDEIARLSRDDLLNRSGHLHIVHGLREIVGIGGQVKPQSHINHEALPECALLWEDPVIPHGTKTSERHSVDETHLLFSPLNTHDSTPTEAVPTCQPLPVGSQPLTDLDGIQLHRHFMGSDRPYAVSGAPRGDRGRGDVAVFRGPVAERLAQESFA